jgi:hypothetical protein
METYVKVRSTKDDTFIRQFATMDDQVGVTYPPVYFPRCHIIIIEIKRRKKDRLADSFIGKYDF